MATFIILMAVFLPRVIAHRIWRADRQTIEEETKRYYTEEGHHIYYDRKLIAALEKDEKEKQQIKETGK